MAFGGDAVFWGVGGANAGGNSGGGYGNSCGQGAGVGNNNIVNFLTTLRSWYPS
jgi:hypothetical protein